MSSISVLILDSQPIIRDAVRQMLRVSQTALNIVQSDSVRYASKLVREQQFDMIISDVELVDGSGIDFIRRTRKAGYRGKVLFLSSNDLPIYNKVAREVGANGYVSKRETSAHIQDSIWTAYRGYSVFNDKQSEIKKMPVLSQRESVVYGYLMKGYSNKKISELLSLSAKTVSTYKARILEKYNASTIIEVMELKHVI